MKKYLFIFLLTGLSQLHAQMPFEFVALTMDFENQTDSIIQFSNDSVASTHWQIGKPSKTVFDSSYSAFKGIVTDTLYPYVPNTFTYFEIPFVPNAYLPLNEPICPLNICFQHKLDIDPASAGAWIDMRDNDELMNIAAFDWSNDLNGADYYYAQVQTDFGYGAWDTLFNGEMGFNTPVSDWTEVCYSLYWIGVSPPRAFDTLYFRFNFRSNSTPNSTYEGWMIDNIVIGKGTGWCGGGIEDELNGSISIFPNPADEFVQVQSTIEFNEGNYEIVDITGRVVSNGTLQYAQSIPIRTDMLTGGIYFMRFNMDGKRGVKKLMKR